MCLCWAAISEGKYEKYKDPKQHINVRIKDLLSRMTLEEKIGQMTQIERTVASTEVVKKYRIGKHRLTINLYSFYVCRIHISIVKSWIFEINYFELFIAKEFT